MEVVIILKKIILFLSSYIPLYVLLIGKEITERWKYFHYNNIDIKMKNIVWFNSFGDIVISVFVGITVILFISLITLLSNSKKSQKEDFFIAEIENETDKHFFNYFTLYFLPCIGLSLNNEVDIFVLTVVIFLIGIVYISNDLIYINPMLTLLGYKVYSAKGTYIVNKEIVNKTIISECLDLEKYNGKQVKLAKSNTKYSLHIYDKTEQS